MPATTDRLAADRAHLLHPLHHPSASTPTIWVEGHGAIITDDAGREYIDGLAGLWNVNVGHGRRALADAAHRQMVTLAYHSVYAGSTNHRAIELSERLSALVYPSINTFFFTSGGAEATETSFKTARFYWKALDRPGKVKVISRMRAYHGLTLAAMSATGLPAFWPMFEPRTPGFSHIDAPDPYRFVNDDASRTLGIAAADQLEQAILREGPDTVAAFIAEPVQGAGGVIIPPDDYFPRIRAICDRYDVLLIADEVITGFGRTGRWFGLERYGIEPDIMQFAKGITSGYVPLGGIGVSDRIRDVINGVPPGKRWMHAYTYSGHPTCCAVALENIAILESERLIDRAAASGARLLERLRGLESLDGVGHVRALGLIAAVEVVADKASKALFPAQAGLAAHLTAALLERGLCTRVALDCICIAPPLVIEDAQIDQLVAIIADAIPAALAKARFVTRSGGSTSAAALVTLALVACSCGGADRPLPATAPAAAIEPAATPAPPPLASLTPADLDTFIAGVVRDTHAIGVNVGVMRNGEVIFAKGYGLASTAAQTPVTPETLFAIGSITKQFTCATALLLEQEGKLSFDDRVAKYVPGLTRAADISIRDLGNHVSGYRDYYPLDFVERPMAERRPSAEVVKDFASRPLDFEPGTRYSYSNTGFLLLGEIIAKAGGEPFGTALKRRILAPLGLRHTRYEPARGTPGLAEGYTPLGLDAAERSIPEGDGWIGAAGGLWSTPRDLMAWELALMDGKVVSPQSFHTMTMPRRLADGRTSTYGCGLQIRDRGPVLVLAHSGGVSGFGSRSAFIPTTRSAVVVLANSDWAGGVLDAIQDGVLARLMPLADAPAVAGRNARETALDLLRQIREGAVDRSQLSDEYSAFLTPERLAAMAKSLKDAGPATAIEAGPIQERGGMEVSSLKLMLGATPASTVLYRTPDGKVQEFLFNRR